MIPISRGKPKLRRRGALAMANAAIVLAAATAASQSTSSAGLSLLDVVALTLRHDPNIALVENDFDSARGALLAAASRFEPLIDASLFQTDSETPDGEDRSSESSSLTTSLGLERELRSGLRLSPGIDLSREEVGGGQPIGRATVSFTLRQPLLRGRGREVTTAFEEAARLELLARRHDLEHRIAERLSRVAGQFWALKAAHLDLEVLRETEASSRDLLETTRRLIAADLTPAAEIIQLEADVVSRQSDRVAGERALFQSRQNLGREIGLLPAAIAGLDRPGDEFPILAVEKSPPPEAFGLYIEQALELRADLRAARQRLVAAQKRLRVAEDDLKPRLDLVVTPSYSGLTEDGPYLSPLLDNIPGLSTIFGFNFSWPLENRRAEGDLIQADAATRQSALAVELLEKSIGADVPAALDAVAQNARQLALIERSVGLFEQALENEVKKLRAGTSTLVDVITQRDRLTSIERQRVAAKLALARSLLDLRLVTGTLFSLGSRATPDLGDEAAALVEKASLDVGLKELTTLPF